LPDGLDERLVALCEVARVAWLPLVLDDVRFVAYLAERLSTTGSSWQALDSLCVGDLYLACGCADVMPAALSHFEERFLSATAVKSYLRHVDASQSFVDEVRQILGTRLLVGEPPAPPRITQYGGRGPLGSWVAIAAQRTALSLLRTDAARSRVKREVVAEAFPVGGDPEMDYLKVRYRLEFRDAIGAAIGSLSSRDRLILRLHLLDHLSHDRIATMYQVSQPTVTRWIAAARESILRETRQILRQRLRVDTAEFESLAALVGSQLDLSLTRLLGDAPHL
jgi:RNA polymerase sigma-70 factor (ECF subfamily)